MKLSFTDMLYALSYALDKVEQELLGVSTYHSYRVAYIVTQLGKEMGLSQEQLSDLSACSMLHDNALTEYINEEYGRLHAARRFTVKQVLPAQNFGSHCLMGERNVAEMPFFGDVRNIILYHHENYDGSGPFGVKGNEMPMYAAMIRLGDALDSLFDLSSMNRVKYDNLRLHLTQNIGVIYKKIHVELFLDVFSYEHLARMQSESVVYLLKNSLPEYMREYPPERVMHFSSVFARIIDYKSPFTSKHSLDMAKKAYIMGEYYGFGQEHLAKLYLAGALHDVGKLITNNSILEKPGRLTNNEFNHMKNHAYGSYYILSKIKGFEEITKWAALHHEKLDGTGYPFGMKADQLCFETRLMACLDIYQALIESRPYKKGFSHGKVMKIMNKMVSDGKIDAEITQSINEVFGKQGLQEKIL